VGDLVVELGVRVGLRVGRVHAVDALREQQDLGADLERTLGAGGVGGEVGHADTGAEDDHATLLHVPDRPARDVGLGDLAHRDGGLDAGLDVVLALEEVLQREAVHDGAEHADVVGARPVHPPLLQFLAAEEVAAADHHRHLGAGADDLGDLAGDGLDHPRIDADASAAEHLAAELQEHAAEAGAGAVGVGPG
jgi:hypothetical protein